MAGKGGVGKTTVGATLGLAAARLGLSVQLIELSGHSSLGSPFGTRNELGYEPCLLPLGDLAQDPTWCSDPNWPTQAGAIHARRITPDDALREYLESHGLGRLRSKLLTDGAIDVVSTSAPGIKDLLTLGKIRSIEASGAQDLVIVDAPAAGHALTFLRSPAGLGASAEEGPIREQADLVLDMLGDAGRCQVVLVTLPEETPVTETVETAYSLEEDIGIKLAPVVINGVLDDLNHLQEGLGATEPGSPLAQAMQDALAYRDNKAATQRNECDRLSVELPLPQLRLPQLPTADLALEDLWQLAKAAIAGLDGQAT